MDARHVTVGIASENSWVARREGSDRALLIDPGDEPQRIEALIADMGVTVEAILITHCHFDHIGAVAPLAKATGAPVYCPKLEVPVLADIMAWVPWPGIGPFESYETDETVEGGERLSLAGLDIDVIFTPGHSPGHVTYSIPDEQVAFSGDVLFQGSVGRVDLPGGDWATLLASIRTLMDTLPADTRVLPGHMGETTLGEERRTNPFLQELPAAG
jgi:hydroxyacylglutathione hydrolase